MKFVKLSTCCVFATLAAIQGSAIAQSLAPAQGPAQDETTSGKSMGGSETTLDFPEETHLVFMREEEKLARDVYLTFAGMYPGQPVFNQIATTSEQTHTDTIRDKLAQFDVEDPNPDTNDLPDSIGIFTGATYGAYFTDKFRTLVARGSKGELEALYVGALIEELDMYDIVQCPKVIASMYDDIGEGGCGLAYTDENALINAYSSLVDGSELHLRAFVGQIEAVIGAGNYEAQYLTQQEVDTILGR
jgi:hypothetical protein